MLHTLHVQDRTGDTQTQWRTDDAASVQTARIAFDRAVREGGLAYEVKGSDGGEQVTSFDPDAERLVVTAPLAGG